MSLKDDCEKTDKTCSNCVWYSKSYETCCNGYSEHRADFRLKTDKCDHHERRLNDESTIR